MEQPSKTKLNLENIAKIFLFLFLISLFFPIRYVFLTKTAFVTGLYSDFTSISLYLSDVFLIITWIFLIVSRGWTFFHVVKSLKWLFSWLVLAVLLNIGLNKGLDAFFFIKFLELFVAYGTATLLFQEKALKMRVFQTFIILSSIQSILALWQFMIQKPIGLFKLGEQQIFSWNLGIANLVVDGIKYIRGYGTFPHPNLLSAFLIVGVFLGIYLFLNSSRIWQKVAYSCAILINILGLTVTFSRGAFLALGIGLIIFFSFQLILPYFKNTKIEQGRNKILSALIIISASFLFSFLIFCPYLLTRATISDQATVERKIYNHIGLKMLKNKPIFGVGIGEGMLHMQQYSDIKLWSWQIQPIHNYFLLAATELGIPGALFLFWIFLSHLKAISYKLKAVSGDHTYCLLLTCLLLMFLVLMMFDHYFYTLQQTQMLLWIVLGIIASETKNPSVAEKRPKERLNI